MIVAVALLTTFGSLAVAQPDGEGKKRGGDFAERIMGFDEDGNGSIEKSELPERMSRILEKLDENGDDVIDASEIASMKSKGRSGDREGKKKGARGNKGDRGAKDGRRGPEGSQGPKGPERDPAKIIDHAMSFDSNGDGLLSRSELSEFFENMPRRGGPQGGRGPKGDRGPGGPDSEGRGGRRGPEAGDSDGPGKKGRGGGKRRRPGGKGPEVE